MSQKPAVGLTPKRLIYLLMGGIMVIVLAIAYSLGARKTAQMQGGMEPGLGAVEPGAAPQVQSADEGEPRYALSAKAVRAYGARGGGGGRGRAGHMAVRPPAEAPPAAPAMAEEEVRESSGVAWAATIASQAASRMVIYTGSVQVRVEDVAKAHEEIARIARESDGYVSESSYNAQSGPSSATITIRVPAVYLDRVVDRVAKLGKLLDKRMNAQEVSEEYVDLTSRKRNLEREELRLLELMQRAGKVSELLAVEETVARVRGEIETISGRLRYLENRVVMSTLTVTLQGPEPTPGAGAPAWTPGDVSRRAANSLLNTGRGLATMGIWLAWYAVVWVPLLLVTVWLIRKALKAVATSPPT